MLQKTSKKIDYFLKKDKITKDEIEELRFVIRFLDRNYYIESNPIIPDQDYDKLFRLLKNLEEEDSKLITETSPTQRISQNIQKDFKTKKHFKVMLSLKNTYNKEDLEDFHKQIKTVLIDDFEYILELKFDGISINLSYEYGELISAVTRGNGTEGENITANIRTIYSIPLKIPELKKNKLIEIRGEIIMPKKTFKKLNEIQEEQGLKPYANTRNACSGSVRQLDPNITRGRKLDAYFYQIILNDKNDLNIKNYKESLEHLKNFGFKISPFLETYKNNDFDKLISTCLNYKDRFKHDFEIDGLVLKINNFEQQEKIGYTSHHPKWAIAYKFPAQRAETIIEDIIIQVGRTGVLTPVAILTPVKLSGVVISKATLHNQDEIDKKDTRIGDSVLIERSGEVIPSVVKVLLEKRKIDSLEFKIPNECPICNSKTAKLPEEVAIRCLNLSCPAQIKRRLIHFCSKDCLDISGLGKSIIKKFVDDDILKDFTDIYKIKEHALKLSTKNGFGGKSIQKLLDSIEESKKQSLARLIHALGIKYIGKRASKTLAENIDNLFDLQDLSLKELMDLEDIGDKTAESISDYLNKEENIKLLKQLEVLGLNMKKTPDQISKKLKEKNLVITGQFKYFSRKEIEKLIEKNDGTVQNTVSKKTNFLILGNNPGSKKAKADELNISNISELEFLSMIGEKIESSTEKEIEQETLF